MAGDNPDQVAPSTTTSTVSAPNSPSTVTTTPNTVSVTTVTKTTASSAAPKITSAVTQPESSDLRVSWIYFLKKEDLTAELTKFGLDTSGTMDILRKRLSTYIKSGKASPTPSSQCFLFPPTAHGNSIPAAVPSTSTMPHTVYYRTSSRRAYN